MRRADRSEIPLLFALLAVSLTHVAAAAAGTRADGKTPGGATTRAGTECPKSDAALTLPAGFCASVFADGIGHARHLAVAQNGVVYVNTWSGRYYGSDVPHAGGFLVALQDKSGAGKATVIERFGETVQSGGAGGSGIAIYKDGLYAEINDRIVRYALPASGSIVPSSAAETVVSGLPMTGDHPMHPFAIDADGSIFVDVASASNSCQRENRKAGSPGATPCAELDTRGGVWRYDANRTNQKFSPAERYSTGIRNAEGFAVDDANHRVYVTQHGRDQLHTGWPDLYPAEQEATLPAEELLELKEGGDYGWPTCYYDPFQQKRVLAPEYGGDGGRKTGECAQKLAPAAAFPAHWAPNDAVFYAGTQFPAHYRNGVFIAFHGSWNRSPYAQGGYNVVFHGFANGAAASTCEIFADGFAGAVRSPDQAVHRPAGLAVDKDGALYVADDQRGRIYKIVYRGGGANAKGKAAPCPRPDAPPEIVKVAKSTAGTAAGAAPALASLVVPNGASREMLELGARIYRGEIGGAACTGCHGVGGAGSPLGPNLADSEWLWSDGSVRGVRSTIASGVLQPQKYRDPMPPMGGAQLSADQVAALAVYVWALGHH